MTWPRMPASIQTIRSPTGRPTSWIQRGTRIDRPRRLAHGPDRSRGIRLSQALRRGRRALRSGETSATVAPMATPRSRRAARHRARRQRAQHRARRLAVIGIVAALALVTLILTAFGSGSPEPVATTTAAAPVASGVPPEPRDPRHGRKPPDQAADRRRGRHRDRLPRRRRRRDDAQARRPPGERGPARPPLATDRGLAAGRARLVPARGRARHRGARRRRDARDGRLLARRRHGRLDLRLRDRRQGATARGSTCGRARRPR